LEKSSGTPESPMPGMISTRQIACGICGFVMCSPLLIVTAAVDAWSEVAPLDVFVPSNTHDGVGDGSDVKARRTRWDEPLSTSSVQASHVRPAGTDPESRVVNTQSVPLADVHMEGRRPVVICATQDRCPD